MADKDSTKTAGISTAEKAEVSKLGSSMESKTEIGKSDFSTGEEMQHEGGTEKLKLLDLEHEMPSECSKLPRDSNIESSEEISALRTDMEGVPEQPKLMESNLGDFAALLKASPDSREKSQEQTQSDKPSDAASSKVMKGVEALVQKIRTLGSPKKNVVATDEDIHMSDVLGDSVVNITRHKEKKSQTPKKMELSPDEESRLTENTSTDDILSPLMTADEIGNLKTSDEELTPSKMLLAIQGAEPPEKTSPLKVIIEKCKGLMGSPKKDNESVQPTYASAKTQTETIFVIEEMEDHTAENRPTYLEVPTDTDASSDTSNKNVLQRVIDTTKKIIKGRKSTHLEVKEVSREDSSSDSGIVAPPILDTPCSGILSDVSDDSTSATTDSSSSADMALFARAQQLSQMIRVPRTQQPSQAKSRPLKSLKCQVSDQMRDLDEERNTSKSPSKSPQKTKRPSKSLPKKAD